ncbi:hypothetical protein RFI_01992 [Reticulomyxa filosa]|uniref:Uncharacterized protein n=1 Tax=Reticulomyxa filosa TaxID=46433 RepID=X6PAJ6_RETFI|nr:hypothetical protein RFI_01992 [Reticulomyxa filosa]|eukprot:ETO35084.1 hypothetical protein RFI_01992 [Reticulomyxa filosa]
MFTVMKMWTTLVKIVLFCLYPQYLFYVPKISKCAGVCASRRQVLEDYELAFYNTGYSSTTHVEHFQQQYDEFLRNLPSYYLFDRTNVRRNIQLKEYHFNNPPENRHKRIQNIQSRIDLSNLPLHLQTNDLIAPTPHCLIKKCVDKCVHYYAFDFQRTVQQENEQQTLAKGTEQDLSHPESQLHDNISNDDAKAKKEEQKINCEENESEMTTKQTNYYLKKKKKKKNLHSHKKKQKRILKKKPKKNSKKKTPEKT